MIVNLKFYGEKLSMTSIGGKFFPTSKAFEITLEEAKDLWINLELGDFNCLSETEMQVALEKELNHKIYNEVEYNPLRKDHDRQDFLYSFYKGENFGDGMQRIGTYDPEYAFQKIDHQEKMETLIKKVLHRHPDWAEIFIAKTFHGESLRSFSTRHGLNEKSTSRKYNSAKEKLEEYFQNPRTFWDLVAD